MNRYPEYSDRYTRSLIPFIGLSIIIHLLILGGTFAYASLTNSENIVKITKYETPANQPRGGNPGNPGIDHKPAPRQRIYRVDFFNKLLIENPIKRSAPEIKKTIVEVKPVKPIAKPEIKPEVKPEVENPIKNNAETPLGKVLLPNEIEVSGEPLQFPDYNFTVIPFNERFWPYFSSQTTKGYDMVYFVVDISKKDGFAEYFEWAKFLDYLLSLEGVQDPPTPVGIAELMEDPYVMTPDMASEAIKLRLDKEEYKIPLFKNYNFVDDKSQIVNALKITELPLPQVYFVDYTGAVRLKLEGRVSDMSIDQVRKALSVIKEIWGMTDVETALATAAIISYQQNLVKEGTATPASP